MINDLTPERYANVIRMTRGHPKSRFISFLIVEGYTDKKIYKNHIDKYKCEIIVANNKDNALKILSILENDSFLGILAIVDADFDILEDKLPVSPNLFFTDTHDLETMILRSPALEKVLSESASEEKLTNFTTKFGGDIRKMLLECGKIIGYLRWISLRDNLSLKFEGLNCADFIDKNTLIIDPHKFIRNIKSRSHNTNKGESQRQKLEDSDIYNKMTQIKSDRHDAWHVCCGHDLISILSLSLRKAIGSTNKLESEQLEKELRLAYDLSFFYKTQLYISIQNWEKINAPFTVLLIS